MSNKEIQETYIFKIKYNPHNDVNKSNTIEHKESILELLELFLELGKQNKLNENVSIEMELAYYDQTPKVYEPPGFDSSAEPHCLKISSAFHKLTHINTGFHSLKCYGIGEIFNKMYNDCEARSDVAAICSAHETDPNVQEQETPKKTKNKNVEMIKAASDGDIVPESEIIDIIESELEEAPKKKRRSANSISLGDFVAERPINPLDNLTFLDCSPVEQTNDDWCRLATENVIVRCICGLNNLPDYIGFATCSICNCTVHRQCYGFLQPNLIEEKKLRCYNCQHITDEAITSSNRLVAQIRLIAFGVHKMGCFDNKIIEQIPDSQKNVALQKLQKVGVIDESTEERPIDAIVLSHALSALFPAKNDSQYLTV